MVTLRIKLFGRFSAERGGRSLEGLKSGKVQELFSYLLIHRSRSHPRESLASLLWSNSTTVASKKFLRQAFWQLQSALEHGRRRTEVPVLLLEPEWVRVNPKAELHLDVAELEAAFARVQGIPGHKVEGRQAADLKRAVGLYSGDLLDGCYHDWCLLERERLQAILVAGLDKLIGYCQKHGEYEAGMAYGFRILSLDRARERTHRGLMKLQCLAGDRIGALRQYDACRRALHEELGVKPSRRTEALHQQIQDDDLGGFKTLSTETLQVSARDRLSTASPDLRQALAVLQDLRGLAQRAIQAIDRALRSERHGSPSDGPASTPKSAAGRPNSRSGEIAL